MSFHRIPKELRALPQWLCWRYETDGGPKATKVPYSPHNGHLASVTDASTWSTFDVAVAACQDWSKKFSGIGFVFTESDPYAFVDLDDPQKDETIYQTQLRIYNEFKTYAERSPSGTGLHLICKGRIPSGRKRNKIELYSSGRYATFTGNVYNDAPIADCNELLNILYTEMGGAKANVPHSDAPQTIQDAEVISRALGAVNGDKFRALHEGRWKDLYPSQSEADLAYIDIIAFYTQNHAQIERLFLQSPLGQRAKAKRKDYVGWMISKSFDNQLPQVDIAGLQQELNDVMAASQSNAGQLEMFGKPKAGETVSAPPGLLGEIAQFMYAASPRPVPEVALAGAISLLAGITGRAFNIGGMGLNQYVLLLAATGTGKEAINLGITKLVTTVMKEVPAATSFLGPREISSPQSLIRHLSDKSQCFVSVLGEFGLRLHQWCSPKATTMEVGLRRTLLDLYGKSGAGNALGMSIYADIEKNTKVIYGPAVTICGESVPSTFYEALDEDMIISGLLPRFFMIEYNGIRPPHNEAHSKAQPPFALIDKLSQLAATCLSLTHNGKTIDVEIQDAAKTFLTEYDRGCDTKINASKSDIVHQLWSRAYQKVLKLAALVSVGINPIRPSIGVDECKWAIDLIDRDIKNLLGRFELGQVGSNTEESKQHNEVLKCLRNFVNGDFASVSIYGVEARYHAKRVIPYMYIQRRLVSQAAFRHDKGGATKAIHRTLNTLVNEGFLRELPPSQMVEMFNASGKAYMIANASIIGETPQ